MKAIRVHEFGGPEVLRLEEVPEPKPGVGEVLIQVKAIGVNPIETYIRSGTYALKPSLPYIPGWECAGVVEAVGEGVTRLRAGDRVYTSGTVTGVYAEKTVAKLETVHPLPERISFPQGAAVDIAYSTAYHALFQRARGVPGDTVLVHGASGGVGIAAVQLARNAGMTVIGTGGTEKGRELVRSQGAHHVIDHSSPDWADQVMRITEGRGVDIVLEMLANVNLAKDLVILNRNGRVAVIGNRGTIEINPRDAMSRRADILGVLLLLATEEEKRSIRAALHAGLSNGTLNPIVGQTYPLAQAAEAHRKILSSGAYGKIVLIP